MDNLPFLPPTIALINAFLLAIVLWWAYKNPEKIKRHYAKLSFAIVGAYTIHLVHLFYNPSFFRSPIITVDYASHYVNAIEMSRFFKQNLRLWGYNPYFSAGFPSGIRVAISNHWAFLFNLILGEPLSNPLAFNLAIFTAHFLPLPLALMTARNFRIGRVNTLIFALLTVLFLEGYDPARLFFWVGMYGFVLAVFLCFFMASLFYRYCQEKKSSAFVVFTITGALAFFIHPLSAFLGLVLCGPFFIIHIRQIRLTDYIKLCGSLVIIVISNLLWLVPYFQFRYLADKRDYCWYSDPRYMLLHPFLFAIVFFLFFVTAIYKTKSIIGWQRMAIFQFIALFVLTFFGSNIGLGETEPYRFIVPLAVLSILCFSSVVEQSLKNVKKIAVFCLCAAAFFYFSKSLPFDWSAVHYQCGYSQLAPLEDILSFIKTSTSPKSRIHVEASVIGDAYLNSHFYAYIPYETQRELLAGQQDVLHSKADFTQFNPGRIFNRNLDTATEARLRPYLELYNVKYFLVHSDMSKRVFDAMPMFKIIFKKGDYVIYEYTDLAESYCYRCQADVKADYDKITVSNAVSETTTLKYHYIETLKVKPEGLEIEPVRLLDDPIPFIRVKNGKQKDFVVYNP